MFKKLLVAFLILLISFFIISQIPPKSVYEISEEDAKTIVLDFLSKIDPKLMSRCKVSLPDPFLGKAESNEENYFILQGVVCGNIAKFWINTEIRKIDCYTKYACLDKYGCKDIGKKICKN